MRKLPLLIVALAAAFTASAFAAPANLPNHTNKRAVSTEAMHEVAGTYELTDGRHARLFVLDDKLYIDINKHDRRELFAVSDHAFTTSDNALTIDFKPDSINGDNIHLSYESDAKAPTPYMIASRD